MVFEHRVLVGLPVQDRTLEGSGLSRIIYTMLTGNNYKTSRVSTILPLLREQI